MKTITVSEFLKRREEWRKAMSNTKAGGMWGEVIVMDPGNEIVCDACNEDAVPKGSDQVILDDEESMAYCQACAKEFLT